MVKRDGASMLKNNLQRCHGVVDLGNISASHVNAKIHLSATLGHKLVRFAVELSSNEGKEIAGLWERINPDGKMAAIAHVST